MTEHLRLIPMTRDEANAFIEQHHRHHKPVTSHRFAIGASVGDRVVGVAIVGNPKARELQDGFTAEVTRLATDGTRNACSFLYGACWRASRALGFRRLITYILNTENGTSLRASGWRLVAQTRGGSWSRSERPRVDKHPLQGKLRWEQDLGHEVTQ